MVNYHLSNAARNDLIRIHHYRVGKFGMAQADKHYDSLFECFNIIAARPFSFESVEHIRSGYRRCVCGADSIYYKITDGMEEIMAIVGRQDLNNII